MAKTKKGESNLEFLEIASVALLPRNDGILGIPDFIHSWRKPKTLARVLEFFKYSLIDL
ncbi:MAG: hypothetical protein MR878_06565 [Campylobacter sp.]|nr:hypothetical protein [Campylobacter sp.]